jgi:hypothetical protein
VSRRILGRDSQAQLDEANRQLTRSEQSVEDREEQLAAARVLLAMMLADRAALKEDNERLRAVLEQSERFGVALSKRYENTKAELAANEVRALGARTCLNFGSPYLRTHGDRR